MSAHNQSDALNRIKEKAESILEEVPRILAIARDIAGRDEIQADTALAAQVQEWMNNMQAAASDMGRDSREQNWRTFVNDTVRFHDEASRYSTTGNLGPSVRRCVYGSIDNQQAYDDAHLFQQPLQNIYVTLPNLRRLVNTLVEKSALGSQEVK